MSDIRRRRYLRIWGEDVSADIDEEMSAHVDLRASQLMRDGVSPEGARRQALAEFGDMAGAKAECRRIDEGRLRRERRTGALADVVQDVRVASRSLLRDRTFTAVALLALALGTGVNAAIFSIADRVLLDPLPGVTAADRLVVTPGGTWSYGAYSDIAGESPGMAAAAYAARTVALRAGSGTELVRVHAVSPNYFDVLGVGPERGRVFRDSDGDDVALTGLVLSHATWRDRYASSGDVIDTSVSLNGSTFSVIGVAPPKFAGVTLEGAPFGWLTIEGWAASRPAHVADPPLDERGWLWLNVTGRLHDGVEPAAAQAAVNSLRTAAVAIQTNDFVPDGGYTLLPATAVAAGFDTSDDVRRYVWFLLAIVAFALVIACANIAGLSLARGRRRAAEFATRAALGAGQGRLVRQLMTESVLLAIGGTLLGVVIAVWLTALLSGTRLPGGIDMSALNAGVNLRVLLFLVGVAVLAAVAFGLLPALAAARTPPAALLTQRSATDSVRGMRISAGLVTVQVALCVMLLVGAGLFLRSNQEALRIELGFDSDGLAAVHISLALQGVDEAQGTALLRRVEAALAETPAITAHAWTSIPPLHEAGDVETFEMDGVPRREDGGNQRTGITLAGPGYFETTGIPLVTGRAFEPGERTMARAAAIVNQQFVREYLNGADAVGRSMRVHGTSVTIVGVAADAHYNDLLEEPQPMTYLSPADALATGNAGLVFRTRGDVDRALADVVAAIHGVDPTLAVETYAVGQRIREILAPQRTSATLLTLLGLLTFILAATGIYAVVAYDVSRRTREFGIRLALGAQPRAIAALVLRGGLAPVTLGFAVGIVAAIVAAKAVASLLYDVPAADFVTIAGVTVLLAAAAVVAAGVPGLRAARTNPATSISAEQNS